MTIRPLSDPYGWYDFRARIAELEATLAQERRTYASVADQLKARIAELEAALQPFAKLKKVEQAQTNVVLENDLITVIVRVGDITAACAALSGEGVTK